jgi:hypothetical protein
MAENKGCYYKDASFYLKRTRLKLQNPTAVGQALRQMF